MLKSPVFTQYTVNEVKPAGWLLNQLKIQANGLSGNLDKIWPDVRDSKWIGGDREGWERVPYWLDGFVPLAWLLDDSDMKKRAEKYINSIISFQRESGWIAPCAEDEENDYDIWAYYLICKVLALYADCSGDDRIEDVLYSALSRLNIHIELNTVFDWGSARWFECLIPIMWLYKRRPEDWMLDMAQKLQVEGVDYEKLFDNWRYTDMRDKGRWNYLNHVVNIAMMLKSYALMSCFSGCDSNAFADKAMKILLRDHGMACGHFSGDECLSGKSPIHGAECCSVAEAMYSYEWLAAITGKSFWADRLENAAFNAFPATCSPDMWTHQYDQQTNQVQCSKIEAENVPFNTNCGESHLFGLEPNFGCCTANFNQAWPKFALNIFMKSDDGIAVSAIAPMKLTTQIGGAAVTAEIVTEYPFEDGYTVSFVSDKPFETELTLRVPSGAKNATIDGKPAECGFNKIKIACNGEKSVRVDFSFDITLNERPNDMVCVSRGNLVFALPIGEKWVMHEYTKNDVERKFPYCDYEIFPTTPWNYALSDNSFSLERGKIGNVPFSPDGAPLKIKANFVPIDWKLKNGCCTETPDSVAPFGDAQTISLIPYGCTNLRLTEFPLAATYKK